MVSNNVVETISLNYEDFNDSFLTCATCMYRYDNHDHIPKLLPCSHTLCIQCLQRIAENVTRTTTTTTSSTLTSTGGVNNAAPPSSSSTFADVVNAADTSTTTTTQSQAKIRCPICRTSTMLPAQGGVRALPPSFLINQLLDLMGSMRKNVVMKCSSHTNEDLMFCETCDEIFCTQCYLLIQSAAAAAAAAANESGKQATLDPRLSSSGSSASDKDMNSEDYDSGCDDSTRRRSPLTLIRGAVSGTTAAEAGTLPMSALMRSTINSSSSSVIQRRQHYNPNSKSKNKIACDHRTNAVPVTVAAKRLTNILNYKAIGCRTLIDKGHQQIVAEISELDRQTQTAVSTMRMQCQVLKDILEASCSENEQKLFSVHAQKRQVLDEQLKLIEQERAKIDQAASLDFLNAQLQENMSLYSDVTTTTSTTGSSSFITPPPPSINLHALAERISFLNDLMADMPVWCEPRENGFIRYAENISVLQSLRGLCAQLGTVRHSSTMPSISPLEVPTSSVPTNSDAAVSSSQQRHELKTGLCDVAGILHCYDCHGRRRTTGGDPVEAFVVCEEQNGSRMTRRADNGDVNDDDDQEVAVADCHVVDRDDGSYEIRCRPWRAGTFKLHVRLFGRSVKNSPLIFYAVAHYPPESSTVGLSTAFAAAEIADDRDMMLTNDNDAVLLDGDRDAAVEGEQIMCVEKNIPFCQPAAIVYDSERSRVLVVDTGNERLVALSRDLRDVLQVFDKLPGMELQGATGATLLQNGNVVLVNWRTRYITECSLAANIHVPNLLSAPQQDDGNVPAGGGGEDAEQKCRSTSFSSAASMASAATSEPIIEKLQQQPLFNMQRLVKRFTHQDLKTPTKIDYRITSGDSHLKQQQQQELLVVDNDASALFVFDYRTCKLKRKMTWPVLFLLDNASRLPMHAATWWNRLDNNNNYSVADDNKCSTACTVCCCTSTAGATLEPITADFVVTDNFVRIYMSNGSLLCQLGVAPPATAAVACVIAAGGNDCNKQASLTLPANNKRGLPHAMSYTVGDTAGGGGGDRSSTLRNTAATPSVSSTHTTTTTTTADDRSGTLTAGSSSNNSSGGNTITVVSRSISTTSGGKENKHGSSLKRLRDKSNRYCATLYNFLQHPLETGGGGSGGTLPKNKTSKENKSSSLFMATTHRWNMSKKYSSKGGSAAEVAAADDNDDATVPNFISYNSISNLSLESLVGLPYDAASLNTTAAGGGGGGGDTATLSTLPSALSTTSASQQQQQQISSSTISSYTAVAIDVMMSYVLCAHAVRGKCATIEVYAVPPAVLTKQLLGFNNSNSSSRHNSGRITDNNRESVMLSSFAGISASSSNLLCTTTALTDLQLLQQQQQQHELPKLVLRIDSRGARLRSVCSLALDTVAKKVYACDTAGSVKMFRYA